MKDKEESKFGKYVGLYLSRYQAIDRRQSNESLKMDIFWPFGFVWFILTKIWKKLFGKGISK